jgi:hypothetical protein
MSRNTSTLGNVGASRNATQVIFTYITWRMSEVAFGRAKGLGGWFLPVTLIAVLATC